MPEPVARSIFSASGSLVKTTTGRGVADGGGAREKRIAWMIIIADDQIGGAADDILHHGLDLGAAQDIEARGPEVRLQGGLPAPPLDTTKADVIVGSRPELKASTRWFAS